MAQKRRPQHRYRHGAEPKLVSLQWSQTDSQTIPWPVAGVASQAFFPSVAVEAAVEAAAVVASLWVAAALATAVVLPCTWCQAALTRHPDLSVLHREARVAPRQSREC